MRMRKLTVLFGRGSGDFMLDRNVAQSNGCAPHRLAYAGPVQNVLQPGDVLEELQSLLEEYAPAWYTQEHQEKIEAVLQRRKRG